MDTAESTHLTTPHHNKHRTNPTNTNTPAPFIEQEHP
jgi:hypothetical protein